MQSPIKYFQIATFLQATSALYIVKRTPGSPACESRKQDGWIGKWLQNARTSSPQIKILRRSEAALLPRCAAEAAPRSKGHEQMSGASPLWSAKEAKRVSWTASHCDCLFFAQPGRQRRWSVRARCLEMEIMGVNPDNTGSVYADLSNIMCVPLVVVRRQTIQQLVLDQISVICWLSCNLQTADECQEGTLDVRAGGVKSGSETLCFSLDILYSRSAAVHLCQFGIAPHRRLEGEETARKGWDWHRAEGHTHSQGGITQREG